jgi:DNA-binding CsgD family transcriptional regulator
VSEANINLVRRFFDGGTRSDLQRYLSFLDPDAEIDASLVQRPYAGIYRGREQIEALFREMNHPWRAVQYVTRTTTARGGDGGVWSSLTATVTVHAGKIASFKVFPDRDDAVKAAGLAAANATRLGRGRRGPWGSQPPLTKRERELVTLIALGRSTEEIAEELCISGATVRTHVRNAMSKLGAHTRAQLVALVLSNEQAGHGRPVG